MNTQAAQLAVRTLVACSLLRLMAEDQERDESGRWTDGGGSAAATGGDTSARSGSEPTRAEKAKASHKPSSKRVQDIADRGEQRVAAIIGSKRTDDNAPVDNTFRAGGKFHGAEVKTFVHNTNDKITMHPPSLARKEKWAKTNKATLHTIVVDARPGKGGQMYYREGVGSFRLASMTPVKNEAHLKRLVRGKG